MNELYGMTAEFAADALAADLEDLFAGQLYRSSAGENGPSGILSTTCRWPPATMRTGASTPRSPTSSSGSGRGPSRREDAAQEVQIILVICLYDDRPDRQGYRDVLHIIHEITARYCKNPVIRIRPGSVGARGGPYTVKKPIGWSVQNQPTTPYYYGIVEFSLEIPTICPEVPFT